MRTGSPDGSVECTLPSDLGEVNLREQIEKQLRHCQFEDKEIFGIRLALEEALVNAVKHGNRMDRAKRVHVHYRILPDRFDIGITDEGAGYNHDDIPDPLLPENLERNCGRGLFLMKHYMTEVTVHAPGNRLTMSKVRVKSAINGEARRP